jgi:hypothetical protein
MSKLINPVVNVDFCRASLRGKKLPPGADDFTFFLQGYIARWAGRAGILLWTASRLLKAHRSQFETVQGIRSLRVKTTYQ